MVYLLCCMKESTFSRVAATIGWDFMDSDALELAIIGEIMNDGYDSDDSDFLTGMSDRDPSFGSRRTRCLAA